MSRSNPQPSGRGKASSVTLRDIRIRYGALLAVDGVDLDLIPGDILALVGPSGCGKTSLLKAVAGLQVLEDGTVHFDSDRIDHLPSHLRQVGMVFQSYALFPHMRVSENVAFGLRIAGARVTPAQRAALVDDALALLRIGHLGRSWPDQLSGGQQQRVALARTLILKPRVLLLDEPLSALDRQLRDVMRSEIRQLVKDVGITTLLVTHDQDEALSMADRIAIMRAGRIEQEGTPRELFDAPRTAFVGQFLGQSSALEVRCVAPPSGTTVRVAIGDVQIDAVWQQAGAAPTRGDPLLLLVRPDGLTLSTGTGESAPLAARVTDQLYMGDKLELRLRLADGQALRTDVAANTQPPTNGTTVQLRVDATRAFAFRRV